MTSTLLMLAILSLANYTPSGVIDIRFSARASMNKNLDWCLGMLGYSLAFVWLPSRVADYLLIGRKPWPLNRKRRINP